MYIACVTFCILTLINESFLLYLYHFVVVLGVELTVIILGALHYTRRLGVRVKNVLNLVEKRGSGR